jgi:class 3 adenylate cyclase
MFCDLVGSTPLAEKLDPEELREVMLVYQEVCGAEIRRFEGYLARYIDRRWAVSILWVSASP